VKGQETRFAKVFLELQKCLAMIATSMSSREFAERLDSVAKGIRSTAEQRAKVRLAGRIKAAEVSSQCLVLLFSRIALVSSGCSLT
jgi:hypothetical protein